MVGLHLLGVHRIRRRLLRSVSGDPRLALAYRRPARRFHPHCADPRGRRRGDDPDGDALAYRHGLARRNPPRSRDVRFCRNRRQGRVRRELRRLPSRRWRRRRGLSEPRRRRLAVGRRARRCRADNHPWRAQCRPPVAPVGDAALRPRRHPEGRADRPGRRFRAVAVDRPAAGGRRRQDLRRQLRGLPWRAGPGQPRNRRAAAERQDLALRRRQGHRRRCDQPGAQQLDAGLGRTPRPGDDQAADGLCAFPRRRRIAMASPAEPFFANRVRVYPRAVRGPLRRIKWAVLILCLAAYYLMPWLRWDRGPGHPDQALLIDLPSRRGYFFAVEIWPQEVYLLAGLMILAAVALFFVTSLFGRLWCGYACPQTMWTDLFLLTERLIEGDRAVRMHRDQGRWTSGKVARKIAKHVLWLVIAALTGGAWVMYFYNAPSLVRDLVRMQPASSAFFFIGLFTTTTYLLAGWA